MFGIDLGITVSSVTCTNPKNELIDHFIIFGDQGGRNYWKRIIDMTEHLTDTVQNICKSNPDIRISPLVAIEEPVFPFRTRNPQSYFNTCCLYALVRNKLTVRGFTIYSIHPLTAKMIAKQIFKGKRLKETLMKRGSLTKAGMIRAFEKLHGKPPDYHTKVGRETLADSFFIAQAGIEKRRLGLGLK